MMVELFIFMHEGRDNYKHPIDLHVFFTDHSVSVEQYETYLTKKSQLELRVDDHNNYSLQLKALKKELCRDDAIVNILIDRLGESLHCLPSSIPRAREVIGQHKLDFLIFADLGMDFISYAIAFARLARYQVS
jgi:hypothetical protein